MAVGIELFETGIVAASIGDQEVVKIDLGSTTVWESITDEFAVGVRRTIVLDYEHIYGTADQSLADNPLTGTNLPIIRGAFRTNTSDRNSAFVRPSPPLRIASSYSDIDSYAGFLIVNFNDPASGFTQGAPGIVTAVADGNKITLTQEITAGTLSFLFTGFARNIVMTEAQVYTGGVDSPTAQQRLSTGFRLPLGLDTTQRASIARLEMPQAYFYREVVPEDVAIREIGQGVTVREDAAFDYDQTTYFTRHAGTTDFTIDEFYQDWFDYISTTNGAISARFRDDANTLTNIPSQTAGIVLTKSGNAITLDASGFDVPGTLVTSLVPASRAAISLFLLGSDGLFFTDSLGVEQNIPLIEDSITLSQ